MTLKVTILDGTHSQITGLDAVVLTDHMTIWGEDCPTEQEYGCPIKKPRRAFYGRLDQLGAVVVEHE